MYKKTVLTNGVRIITETLEHLKSVSLGIWVDTGSRDESREENGISHFIEHMIFKGTKRRDSLGIAKELDAIGGMSNAFTGKENTCFHAKVLGKHFLTAADILSDIFINSLFDHNEMERERQVILQEINMMQDSPDDNIHVLFNRFFWPDHPIGLAILGSAETVSSIDRETILQYIKNYYVPERVVVAAAGHVDHEEMVSYFGPLFSSLKKGDTDPQRGIPYTKGGVSVHYKDLEQVHICLGGNAPSQLDEKRFACTLFNTILGGNMSSRLFQEIRENRGLAYAVYSFVSAYTDTGLFGVYVATDAGNVNPVLETIQREIAGIIAGNLSESDLAAAKDHLTGGIYLSSENNDSRMMRLAKNEINFKRYIDYQELVDKLDHVNVDEVIDVARGIFRDGSISLTTLGPFEEEALDMGTLEYK